MYYEVYVDVLFVENLWMNIMLLLLAAWAGRVPVRGPRIAAAAGMGSLGACILTVMSAQLSGISYFLGTFVLAAGMIFIGLPGRKHFWSGILSLYLESFLLSGVFRYLEQFHRLSGIWFAFFGSISVLFLYLGERFLVRRRKKRELTFPVVLTCGAYEILVEAFYDTGNSLLDPVSGKPVSILSGDLMKDLLLKSGKELLPRMVPYHTISQKGVLKAYILDSMEIRCPSGSRILEKPMLACMPEASEQYQLILHRDLLSS